MNRKTQLGPRDVPASDDAVLAPFDHEAALQELDRRQIRERSVARLRLVWTQRRFLLRFMLYGLLASTVIAFLIPKRYTSTGRLMPPDAKNKNPLALLGALTGSSGGALQSLGGQLLGQESSADLFVGVLKSRTVKDALISKFDLRKVYGERYMEDAEKDLEKHTDIAIDAKSGIITIEVTDKNAQRAEGMVREYVDNLDQEVNRLTTSAAHRERGFLEGRLSQVKQELEGAEKEFSQFASKNAAINVPEQGRAMIGAAATLEGQLIATQTELEGLRQIYADSNVRVRSAQARVDELRRQLQKLGGNVPADASNNSQNTDSMYPSIRQLPLLGVTYADLFRKTRVEEVVFETLTREYELAKVEEAKEIPVVKVLDPANAPEKKSFPPRLLLMFLGTLLALSIGITWIFGSALWQQTDPNDLRKVFVLEVFSTVKGRLPSNGSKSVASGTDVEERNRLGPRI